MKNNRIERTVLLISASLAALILCSSLLITAPVKQTSAAGEQTYVNIALTKHFPREPRQPENETTSLERKKETTTKKKDTTIKQTDNITPAADSKRPEAVTKETFSATAADSNTAQTERTVLTLLNERIRKHKEYPGIAMRRRLEGIVTIRLLLHKDGSLGYCRLEKSSGHSILDNASVTLIKKITPLPLPRQLEKELVITQRINYLLNY